MFYSIIIPANYRPNEVSELLDSIFNQEFKNFEVIITDNSPDDFLRKIVTPYQDKMRLTYLYEKGLGVSESRNLGAKYATGNYLVFIDSDCILPPQYLEKVNNYLKENQIDAYGGPDCAHESFTRTQKAINYAMTSFYTTGGIRGGKSQIGTYHPRSFNMGVKRKVFNEIKGFSNLKVSEDIDFSIRLYKNGCSVALIEDAFVYHKRRATFGKFFRQVFAFGNGRFKLQHIYRDAVRPIHMLPSIFVIYLVSGIILSLISKGIFIIWLGSILAYASIVLIDSVLKNRNIAVGLLSVCATFIMLTGYGSGMLKAMFSKRSTLKKK